MVREEKPRAGGTRLVAQDVAHLEVPFLQVRGHTASQPVFTMLDGNGKIFWTA